MDETNSIIGNNKESCSVSVTLEVNKKVENKKLL